MIRNRVVNLIRQKNGKAVLIEFSTRLQINFFGSFNKFDRVGAKSSFNEFLFCYFVVFLNLVPTLIMTPY